MRIVGTASSWRRSVVEPMYAFHVPSILVLATTTMSCARVCLNIFGSNSTHFVSTPCSPTLYPKSNSDSPGQSDPGRGS